MISDSQYILFSRLIGRSFSDFSRIIFLIMKKNGEKKHRKTGNIYWTRVFVKNYLLLSLKKNSVMINNFQINLTFSPNTCPIFRYYV